MKYLLFSCFLLIVLLPSALKAQNSDKSDVLLYEAPSEKFRDINLQSHKELPRFGHINHYTRFGPNGKPMRSDMSTMNKLKTISLGYRNYYNLLTFKYMSDLYEDMDKERLTAVSDRNKTEKNANSYAAQQHLMKIVRSLYTDDRYKNGFQGSNTFETLRNYKTFINEEFSDIQKWSSALFKEGTKVGYLVSILNLGSYDFDKSGYWIIISFNTIADGTTSTRIAFDPKTAYGEDLLNKMKAISKRTPLEVFLPLDPANAEKLVESNTRRLYLVKKIALTYANVQTAGNRTVLNLNYHLKSPILDIYEDEGLTIKIASLSMEDLTFKNQN